MQTRVAIFLGLNAVRFFSLVGLILVFSASIVTLVSDIKAIQRAGEPRVLDPADGLTEAEYLECLDYLEGSTVPNQPAGAFWAIVNRFLIIFQIIILFLSECGWPSRFFATYFPVLGPDFGVGALGIFECLIGAAILSHHVNTVSLVSAFFLFAVGCLSMLAGLIFRESSRTRRSLTEWHDTKKPAMSATIISRDQLESGPNSFISHAEKAHLPYGQVPLHSAQHTGSSLASAVNQGTPVANAFQGYGFARAANVAAMGEKAAGLKGFLISRPLEASLPKYAPRGAGSSSQPDRDYPSGGAAL